MRELTSLAEIADAAEGDALIIWAAQGYHSRVRAWTSGNAVVVACPALSRRDRLAVHGDVHHAAVLLRRVFPEVGCDYRPVGDADLIEALVTEVDGLEVVAQFGWMDTTWPPPVSDAAGVCWLTAAEWPEVTRLLRVASPSSYAWPGQAGVRRWAGLRDEGQRLISTAADAWSAPGVGFVSGVATDPNARGRGHARAVCGLLVQTLVSKYGQAALIVDTWNTSAVRLYQRLGLRLRQVAAARARPAGHPGVTALPAPRRDRGRRSW
ncbi:MAG: GNAT family N-acetyltransferase [Micromonosporaceae bacterium]|nr:GNAT family N-acetyltransferase [Micromonosporaceae bacterium]